VVVGVVPARRAGRKAIRIAIFIGAKWSAQYDTTRCRYCHSCWYDCWKAVNAAWREERATEEMRVMPVEHSLNFCRMCDDSLAVVPMKPPIYLVLVTSASPR